MEWVENFGIVHAGSLSWQTGNLELNKAIIDFSSNTCAERSTFQL